MSRNLRNHITACLGAILCLVAGKVSSQTYFVTQDNGAFFFEFNTPTDITIADNNTEELSIGFDFNFFGNSYSTCHLSENGFIQFGNAPDNGCCQGQFLPSSGDPNNLIAAAWMDNVPTNCCSGGQSYSQFQYETIGNAPDRVFIITLSLNESCGVYYSGQIKIFEGSDIIEIHTEQWADGAIPCSNVTQGIENTDGTEAYYFYDRNANTNWSVPCCNDVIRFTPAYSLPQNDAGISYIFNSPACEGTYPIDVLVTNFGALPLDSVVIEWTWDNNPQSSLLAEFSIPLSNGQSSVVEVGSQTFVQGEEYAVTASTTLPNGQPDDSPSNDSYATTIATGVKDTFTIGGVNPDFVSFVAAISFLETTGVCDTTWMLVRPGTYNEQITIPWIPGALTSRVIFKAENGDSSSVILEYEPVESDRYVVRLNNTAGITLEHMTINALGTDYGRVIQLSLYSFDNLVQHCVINGINTSSTSRDFSCIYSNAYNPDNVFQFNTIRQGSVGVHHEIFDDGLIIGLHETEIHTQRGSNSGILVPGLQILNNSIEDFSYSGILTVDTKGVLMLHNLMSSDKDQANGILLIRDPDTFRIAYNQITLSSGKSGIELNTIMPTSNSRSLLFNNMVYVHHDVDAIQGIYSNTISKSDIFHNTVKVSGPNELNFALELGYLNMDSVFNNLFVSQGGSPVFYVGESLLSMMNFNGLFHTGPTLGMYINGTLEVDDLQEWQSLTGFETDALFYPPYFQTESNLHLGNSYFNGQASPAWATDDDVDGEERNNTHPDIGADEFDPQPLDASIAALLSPAAVCDTFQDIKVVVINLGTDTLTDVEIHWSLNGDAQTPVSYSGEILPEGDTAQLILQTLAAFNDQVDTLLFWTEGLNGDDDMFMQNDTLASIYSLPMSGAYTIGGVGPDFTTIADAVTAMETFSICGPVTLLLRNGTYAEQFSIDSIPGSTSINTVTFTSEATDSSLATIQFDFTGASIDYIVQLDGAKHIRFEHLSFKTLNSSYANIFFLRDGAGDVRIEHCYLEGSSTSSFGNNNLCYTNDAFDGNVTLRNNYFLNGTRAIHLLGNYNSSLRQDSFVIEQNQFVNQRSGAILVQNLKDVVIEKNSIVSNTTATYTALQLTSSHGTNRVASNKVNLTATGDGITISGVNDESGLPGLCQVYNNMSSVVSGAAFSLSGNRRLLFVYNTGYSAGTGASSHHAIRLFGGDSISVQNNIGVANAGRGYSETFYIPIVHADYNNYFTSGTQLAYRANTPYADLTSWQAGTALDSNSISVDPLFVANADLHILNTSLNGVAAAIPGITTDIDGQLRDVTHPDIGADEIGTEPHDAGILKALPEMPFARGLQDVKAIIRNFGSDTLFSAVISWELNGVPQPDYYYASELPSLADDTIILGALDFELSTAYQLKIWSSTPNQTLDSNPVNDTLDQSAIYPAVSGAVIVGTTGEVLTIGNAVSAMALGGILDSVQFELQSGTYHESVSLNAAAFLECGSQVVFTSLTGHAADVVWDNLGTGTHTVLFNGADGIEFRHLTIKTVINAVQAIRFQNASTCNVISHCIVTGVSTTSSSSTYAVILGVSSNSTNYNHNNTIENNTISKGSYNIYWDGFSGTTGLNVNNNVFQDAYAAGIYLYRLKAPRADYNTISSTSSINLFIGIYGESCAENTSIAANKILLHGKRSYGIQFYLSNGTVSLPARIANNFIIGGSGASSFGLYTHTCNYVHVYHNTIRISGGETTCTNILRNLGGNILYLNNILDNRANGRTMQFNGTGTPLTTNYNTHYTAGTNLINYLGTNYTTLAAWQATGRDVNSQYVEPLYDEAAPLSYAIENAEMNGMAISGTNTPDDIEGMLRDTSMPDIGCDEFDLFTHDVGLSGITYPHLPFPNGINTVYIKFINNGADTLTSMEVLWEVDSVLQPGYMWTGLLPSAGTYDSLDIGEFDFAPNVYHHIKVWVSQPNGVQDELASNDTVDLSGLYPGLHGTYTIGGIDPDFETISEAVAELNTGGASAPVTFNIRSGIYLDTILINDFPGSDCDRPVIFQSASGNQEDVLITNLGLDAHTIVLNGADGVIFQHLSINSVNPAYRHVISYDNGANCNQFLNNTITGFQSTSQASSAAVIYSGPGLDMQNQFLGNLINYGSYSFYLYGSSIGISGTRIIGNTLEQPRYRGAYAREEFNLAFDDNLVNTLSNDEMGIVLYLCHQLQSISGNTFHIPGGGYGLYVEECDNLVSAPGLISNNMINVGGSGTARGMLFTGSSYHNILHNNIVVYSTNPYAGNITPLYLSSCPSLKVFNNGCSNTGIGYGIYAINNTSFSADYNDYSVDGANMGFWNGVNAASLANWQTISSQDQNALEIDPQFMSLQNLHVSNILLNGAGQFDSLVIYDIDGELRGNPPDIGADEFDPSIANDAGVFMAVGPVAPFAPGIQPITIALKNYGADTLTAVKIRWVVNGIEQPIYTWSGSLPSAQCDTVIIGMYSFPEYTAHDLIYWTEAPNNIPDSSSINDTLQIANLYPALSGLYTVGGVLPDFNLFSQLELALGYGGILGDVTFSIRNGTYATQLLIQNFPRSSSQHTVLFTSQSGDSSLVNLTRNFTASDPNNYTVRLKNAHGIRFQDIGMSSSKGRVLELTDGSSNIEIAHCLITGVDLLHNYSGYELLYSGTTSEDSLLIHHNRFENGGQGIYLIGSSGDKEKHHIIEYNQFYNNYSRAIYSRYSQNLQIKNNYIESTTKAPDAIVVSFASGIVDISQNDIRLLAGGTYGISIYASDGTALQPLQLNNNYILSRNSTYTTYGIAQENCNYIVYNYNTVRLENVGAGSVAFVDQGSYNNIHVRNCIFSNESGGMAMNTSWSPYYTNNTVNYCNLYATGPVLAYFFTEYVDHQALQTGTNQNLQGVSVESLFDGDGPDVLQAALDGEAMPVSGVTTDIYGGARNGSTPDIGAREFTLLAHDVGAKFLAAPGTYCGLSETESVTIRIQNYGSSTETGFNVGYKMNESSWVIENIGSLYVLPGAFLDFTFSFPENMMEPGVYDFELLTALATDLNTTNDSLHDIIVEHIPALTMPVSNMIPVDGTLDLEKTVSLSWLPAENATRYDIYIWPDGDPQPGMPQVPNLTQINTLYSQLSYGTLYNWQVVAKNVCSNMIPGPIQQFSVRELPDLVTEDIIAPGTAFSGQTIQVEWQVLNIGTGETKNTLWSDAVYLSSDATLNTSYDIYLGAVQNLTALNPGIGYTNTGTFTIPNGIVGNYYVFIFPDRWSNLVESNNTNNWDRTSASTAISLTPAPDLIVTSVTTPTTVFSGETIPVSYTVKNNGLGSVPVNAIWKDRMIFGDDPYNPFGYDLNLINKSGMLSPDSTYQVMVMAPIPQAIFGTYYMHVKSDLNNQVYEFAAESNNFGSSLPIEVILTPPPDLIVTELDFPDTVSNNELFTLEWTVLNQGANAAEGTYWIDQVYVSKSPIYNTNFLIPLTSRYRNTPLPASESYVASNQFRMSNTLSGEYYIYIYTDQTLRLFEYNMENNNVLRSTGTIFIQNADIVPENPSSSDTVIAGSALPLVWNKINRGPGGVFERNIRTNYYISNIDTLDASAYSAGSKNRSKVTLLANDTIAEEVLLSIPDQFSQDVFVLIQEDADNTILESEADETNNVLAVPVFVSPGPLPDLVTNNLVVPDTVVAGSVFSISFQIANEGTKTILPSWKDRVYFSFDSVWMPAFATELTTITQTGNFFEGSVRNFNPAHVIGANTVENVYYIYVVNDVLYNTYEGVTGELNNVTRSDPFYVQSAPPVDLILDTVKTTATTFASGQTYPFEWTVLNASQIPLSTSTWSDIVYLSADTVFSLNDIQVEDIASSGILLSPGETRGKNKTIKLPNGVFGDYYILFVADALDVQSDPNRGNNVNTIRDLSGDPLLLSIILSPSPDLNITLFNTPALAIAGQPMEVIYKVLNSGNYAAQFWQDKLFLSTDNTLSQNDILLFANSNNQTLDPAAEKLDTAQVIIPAVSLGNYILILQTDATNFNYEHNGEHNNILTRALQVTAPPPSDLEVSTVTIPISIIAGDNIEITWTTNNIGANPASGIFREVVYISPDTIWDTDDVVFGLNDDQIYLPPGGSRETDLIENVVGVSTGDYFAIVQTDARQNLVESDEDNNFTNSVDPMNVDVKTLVMDSLTTDTLYDNLELYYKLIIGAELDGETVILDLKGDSLSGLNELFVKYEQMPTRAEFDFGFEYPFNANQQLLLPDVQPGTYYILAYGLSISSGQQDITLLARVIDYEILSVSPNKGTQNTLVTVKVRGSKLGGTVTARLRNSFPWFERVSSSVYQFNDNLMYITFDLTDVPVDTYAIDLIKVDSSLAYVSDFVVLADGGNADLEINAQLPGAVPTRGVVVPIVLTYINNGDADYINPSVIIEAPYGNIISYTLEDLRNGIGASELIVPLIEENGPANILRPGGSGRIQVFANSSPSAIFGVRKNE